MYKQEYEYNDQYCQNNLETEVFHKTQTNQIENGNLYQIRIEKIKEIIKKTE